MCIRAIYTSKVNLLRYQSDGTKSQAHESQAYDQKSRPIID